MTKRLTKLYCIIMGDSEYMKRVKEYRERQGAVESDLSIAFHSGFQWLCEHSNTFDIALQQFKQGGKLYALILSPQKVIASSGMVEIDSSDYYSALLAHIRRNDYKEPQFIGYHRYYGDEFFEPDQVEFPRDAPGVDA